MLVSLLLVASFVVSPAQAGATVSVCHNGDDGVRLLTVSESAAAAHLAHHGDTLAGTWFRDADGDGFGDPAAATVQCPTAGFVLDGGDCDDTDAEVHPGAVETCGDGVDDTCDGVADEGCVVECPCFTLDELDATWAAFVATEPVYTDEESVEASCDGWASGAAVSLARESEDWLISYFQGYLQLLAYERASVGFAANLSESGASTCWVVERTASYSSPGGPSSDERWDTLEVTADEAQACLGVIGEWAGAMALTCD